MNTTPTDVACLLPRSTRHQLAQSTAGLSPYRAALTAGDTPPLRQHTPARRLLRRRRAGVTPCRSRQHLQG